MQDLADKARVLIESRFQAIFIAYRDGMDVSPAERFRTEGIVQACCELELMLQDEAQQLMNDCYKKVFNRAMLGMPDTAAFEIPLQMQKAPVVPSTSD